MLGSRQAASGRLLVPRGAARAPALLMRCLLYFQLATSLAIARELNAPLPISTCCVMEVLQHVVSCASSRWRTRLEPVIPRILALKRGTCRTRALGRLGSWT